MALSDELGPEMFRNGTSAFPGLMNLKPDIRVRVRTQGCTAATCKAARWDWDDPTRHAGL